MVGERGGFLACAWVGTKNSGWRPHTEIQDRGGRPPGHVHTPQLPALPLASLPSPPSPPQKVTCHGHEVSTFCPSLGLGLPQSLGTIRDCLPCGALSAAPSQPHSQPLGPAATGRPLHFMRARSGSSRSHGSNKQIAGRRRWQCKRLSQASITCSALHLPH